MKYLSYEINFDIEAYNPTRSGYCQLLDLDFGKNNK